LRRTRALLQRNSVATDSPSITAGTTY